MHFRHVPYSKLDYTDRQHLVYSMRLSINGLKVYFYLLLCVLVKEIKRERERERERICGTSTLTHKVTLTD